MGSLVANSICKEYPTQNGTLSILRDVSVTFSSEQATAIMGPSGSGKSTLLNILGTLEPPTSGAVTFDGQNPFDLSEADLARFRNRNIGFVFQEHHLLPQCSVLENVLLPTLPEKSDPQSEARAKELLGQVGLAERLNHRPAELSGGERQRVAIARALINRPLVLLADEPTGNLDRKTAEGVASLLAEFQKTEGIVLIVVTHSSSLAEGFGRKYELLDGALGND